MDKYEGCSSSSETNTYKSNSKDNYSDSCATNYFVSKIYQLNCSLTETSSNILLNA